MKTRTALVSNSSSSSFIVVFPCKPTFETDVYKWMFNESPGSIVSCYDEQFSMTHEQIAKIVYQDCEKKKKATLTELTEEFERLVHNDLYPIETAIRENNERNMMQTMIDHIHDIPAIGQVMKILKEIREIELEFDRTRDILMCQHNLRGPLTGKEPKEFQDADNKLNRERYAATRDLQEAYYKLSQDMAKDRAKKFIEDHKGWWYTVLSYEDHSPDGSFMEHQNVFRHLEYIRISHH